MGRGKYIVFEGGDGSGKTTLACAVFTSLAPDSAQLKRFPSDGIVGELIRKGLMGTLAIENKPFMYLFAADGMQENLAIEDALWHGRHVICDRHPLVSGEVFQLEHHDRDQIEAVYGSARADGLLAPDLMFVVDVPTEVAQLRMCERDKYKDVVFERDSASYIEKMRQRYLELAGRYGATVLDGTKPIEDLVKEVCGLANL
jgi:dTMP kinase